MSSSSSPVAALRERVKRRRNLLEHYLNGQFYDGCRRILAAAKRIDEGGMFAKDPSSVVSGYRSVVKQPMWFDWIGKKLDNYDYATCDDFISDMRLVVNNCYSFNEESSAFAAAARKIECEMEGMFVKELGIASPSDRDIKALATGLTSTTTERILHVAFLYEGYVHTKGSKLDLSKFTCATRIRILQVLKEAAAQKEAQSHQASRNSTANSKDNHRSLAKGAPRPIPVKTTVPAKAPAAGPGPGASAATAPPLPPLPVAPPMEQHAPRRERSLDRVPQNVRTDGALMKNISPLQSLDDSSGSFSEGSE